MKYVLGTLMLFASSLASAQVSFCYGTTEVVETETSVIYNCKAGKINVPPTSNITAPANIEINTDQPVTLVVSLMNHVWTSEPVLSGGTILTSGSLIGGRDLSIACTDTCVLALPQMTGGAVGELLVAHVRLFNPNGSTTTFVESDKALASIRGEFYFKAAVMNPASNPEQRTLLRCTAEFNDATVWLVGYDDLGVRYGAIKLVIPADHSVQLNSGDLENGAPEKGLPNGFGDGAGKWRIEGSSADTFGCIALSTGLSSLPVE